MKNTMRKTDAEIRRDLKRVFARDVFSGIAYRVDADGYAVFICDDKYMICEDGTIYRHIEKDDSYRQVANRKMSAGYFQTRIEGKDYLTHRIVAACFCIQDRKEQIHVNHLDGDKVNNVPENLEWCTPSENMLHSYKVLGHPRFGNRPAMAQVSTICY